MKSIRLRSMAKLIMRWLRAEWFSIVLIAIGIWIIQMSNRLPVSQGDNLGLNPAFYPRLLGAAIVIAVGVDALRRSIRRLRSTGSGEAVQGPIEDVDRTGFWGTIVIAGLYTILVPIIGFLLLTPVTVFVWIWLLGGRRIVSAVIISVVLTAVVYGFFWGLLYIRLPVGVLIPDIF